MQLGARHLKSPTFDGHREAVGSVAGGVTVYDVDQADKAITEIDDMKIDDHLLEKKDDGVKKLSISRTRVGYYGSNLAIASSFSMYYC